MDLSPLLLLGKTFDGPRILEGWVGGLGLLTPTAGRPHGKDPWHECYLDMDISCSFQRKPPKDPQTNKWGSGLSKPSRWREAVVRVIHGGNQASFQGKLLKSFRTSAWSSEASTGLLLERSAAGKTCNVSHPAQLKLLGLLNFWWSKALLPRQAETKPDQMQRQL